MNSRRLNAERRELLGFSGPSLLAGAGLFGGVAGGVLLSEHPVFAIAAAAGAYCVWESICWSLREDEQQRSSTGEAPETTRLGRLRAMTRQAQRLFFVLILLSVLFGASLRARGISVAERTDYWLNTPAPAPIAPPSHSLDEV